MAKPTYSKATQKVQRIFARSLNKNSSPLPEQNKAPKMPKLTAAQLLAIANNGVWKP